MRAQYAYMHTFIRVCDACRREINVSLPLAARKAKPSFPLQLTGAYRLEGATLANRLAASRNYGQLSKAESGEMGPAPGIFELCKGMLK